MTFVFVEMSTLVYFASGANKPEYEDLPFDEIYLIDSESFQDQSAALKDGSFEPFRVGRVTCVGMRCLWAVDYLKSKNVKVDCLVAVNLGCYHREIRCPLGSSYFLGYVMQILNDDYVHVANFGNYWDRTDVGVMGLPYEITKLTRKDKRYINPKILTHHNANGVELFQMHKINETSELKVESEIKVSIVRDSIWNYYDKVDLVVHSISDFERRSFFDRKPRVITWKHIAESKRVYCLYSLSERAWKSKFEISGDLDLIFEYCVENKINKVGFTPWGVENCNIFVEKLQNYTEKYPKEIILFHLNKDDYKEITTAKF
ncbi:MAG: hypothetical protein LBJ00_09965 [Planctomycetaceae bacterium]|jgi:hypothetical protein|nr:hypothetical protein [Planctomycetaceae bacterium]